MDLPEGFREDLRSEWVPDAIGGADASRLLLRSDPLAAEPEESLQVPRDGKILHAFVQPLELRVALHVATGVAIRSVEFGLLPSVYGIRDASTPYSSEWRKFLTDARDRAGKHQYVVSADVASFTRNVRFEYLKKQPWMTPSLARLLSFVTEATGQPLHPACRWTSRIANAVLDPVDKALSGEFMRWQDDYFLFLDRQQDADPILDQLEDELRKVGLKLGAEKSVVERPEEFVIRRLNDWAAAADIEELFREALTSGKPSALRYALPRLGAAGATLPLMHTHVLADRFPQLLPRLAWYLDLVLPAAGADEFNSLLSARSSDRWSMGRLLAVAARKPEVLTKASVGVVHTAAESAWPSIRELAERTLVQVETRLPRRSFRRLGELADLADGDPGPLPMVETRL